LVEEKKEDPEDLGANSLVKFLLAQPRSETAAPKLIINNDGCGPFSQFSFPVGGLPKSPQEIDRQGIQRMLIHPAIVPEMPATYPGRIPLTSPSPKSKSRPEEPSPRSQAQSFPILDDTYVASGTTLAPAAKTVLDKMTDLSFMLQSKLAFPK
jgi:hypothetical protein